jgi:putative ATP-dependent endonuclease of the OLD family
MKLLKAKIINFRLLHDFEIAFDVNTTSIVGKNNSGKTSLSAIFDIFLNKEKFAFADFSLKSYKKFLEVYKTYIEITEENKEEQIRIIQVEIPKIQLRLSVKYGQEDNWTNIKPFFTSLEEDNELSILCEYAPESTEKFFKDLKDSMEGLEYSDDELLTKIESHHEKHYKISFRPYSVSEETENVKSSDIRNLFQTKFIGAQRVLDDSNSVSKSTLSTVFQKQFNNEKAEDDSKPEELLKIIESTSGNIDAELTSFFSSFIKHFSTFGFPGMGAEKVELKSQLDPDTLFNSNIKLFYNHDGVTLPEKYNGLGYSNLIFIISQIIGFYTETKDAQNSLKLIFIEEPESHMHPQMQSVFIANINKFLKDVGLNAQIVITTHSSHILSNSELENIRYFKKCEDSNSSIVKDLMAFNINLTDEGTKIFLQQYLTLGKCDLFFADKAILFEGTVERILLPIFIDKIDRESSENKLSEQYITSIEVGGAYISKFKELLEFLDLKTLIITDIDSVKKGTMENKKGKTITTYKKTSIVNDDDLLTSNETLKDWIPGKPKIMELLTLEDAEKIQENIRVAYQTNVSTSSDSIKCGRSFEEAFIIDNHQYIFDNKEDLVSLKNCLKDIEDVAEINNNSYEIQDFIDRNKKKTEFAFDLLNINKDNWEVPTYIREGLIWLSK